MRSYPTVCSALEPHDDSSSSNFISVSRNRAFSGLTLNFRAKNSNVNTQKHVACLSCDGQDIRLTCKSVNWFYLAALWLETISSKLSQKENIRTTNHGSLAPQQLHKPQKHMFKLPSLWVGVFLYFWAPTWPIQKTDCPLCVPQEAFPPPRSGVLT